MRAIFAEVVWDGPAREPIERRPRFVAASRALGDETAWEIVRGGRVAFGCTAAPMPRGSRSVVAAADVEGIFVASESRLVDRERLAQALSARADWTDVELIAAAYRRWGTELACHLTGDFGVIVHDPAQESVLVVCGASEARQLYVSVSSSRAFVSSHPTFHRLAAGLGREDLDLHTVEEYLLRRHSNPWRTFFAGLERVPPGHQIVLRPGSTHRMRWLQPPATMTAPLSVDEGFEAFRGVFERCVADTIDPGALHVAHLSGGLDSSSIVTTLPRLDVVGATFELATAVFPTVKASNETAPVAAVRSRVPYPWRPWNAERIDDWRVEQAKWPWPAGTVPTAIGNYDDVQRAAEIGAVAILSGYGGDGLMIESRVFQDLARQRRWHTLWNELGAPGLRGGLRGHFAREVMRDLLPKRPQALRRAATPAPSWFGPALQARDRGEAASPTPNPMLSSLVQQQVWDAMMDANDLWVVEGMNLRALDAGIELRYPYQDPRLLAFVLAVPYDRRLLAGTSRRLQREGLADRIPFIVRRRVKPDFNQAAIFVASREWAMVESEIEAHQWLSAPYVSKPAFDTLMEGATAGRGHVHGTWLLARRIWTLELWLRQTAM